VSSSDFDFKRLFSKPGLLTPGVKPLGKVRVNREHKSVRNPTGCWMFDGIEYRNIVDDHAATGIPGSGVSLVINKEGPAAQFDGTNNADLQTYTESPRIVPRQVTVIARCSFNGTNDQAILTRENAFQLWADKSGSELRIAAFSGNPPLYGTEGGIPSDDTLVTLAWVLDGVSNTAALYVNGEQQASGSIGSNVWEIYDAVWIGSLSGNSKVHNGDISFLFIDEGLWSPEEIREVSNDLYSLVVEESIEYVPFAEAVGDTVITPTVGSISVAGQDVAMTTTLAPAAGSLVMAGQDVNLAFDTPIDPAAGVIAIAGQDVTLTLPYVATPAAGSIAVAGQTVNLAFDTPIDPAAGSLVMAGQDIAMTVTITPVAGSLVMAGQDVIVISAGTTITPAVGSIVINGQDVTMLVTLAPAAGSISIAGQDIGLTVDALLVPLAGSLVMAGQDIDLTVDALLEPLAGSFAVAGQDVNIVENRIITPTSAILTINGQPVDVDAEFVPVGKEQFVIRLTGSMIEKLLEDLK
jgi:hypothetical protein